MIDGEPLNIINVKIHRRWNEGYVHFVTDFASSGVILYQWIPIWSLWILSQTLDVITFGFRMDKLSQLGNEIGDEFYCFGMIKPFLSFTFLISWLSFLYRISMLNHNRVSLNLSCTYVIPLYGKPSAWLFFYFLIFYVSSWVEWSCWMGQITTEGLTHWLESPSDKSLLKLLKAG